ASGHDYGQQERTPHRRTRGHVRHSTHPRADGAGGRARRREISAELAGLMHNHETELEAAERRIRSIPRCGAAKLKRMEETFLNLLEAIGEDPQHEGLLRTPARAACAFEFLTNGYRQDLD